MRARRVESTSCAPLSRTFPRRFLFKVAAAYALVFMGLIAAALVLDTNPNDLESETFMRCSRMRSRRAARQIGSASLESPTAWSA